jgi:hypothetical protein
MSFWFSALPQTYSFWHTCPNLTKVLDFGLPSKPTGSSIEPHQKQGAYLTGERDLVHTRNATDEAISYPIFVSTFPRADKIF